jgi:hypothetical protein
MQTDNYRDTPQTLPENRMFNTDPREIDNTAPSREQLPPPVQRKHPARNGLLLCLLALLIAGGIIELTGGFAFTSLRRSLPTRAFAISGHGSLVINDGSGTFHINAGHTNQVIIQGSEYEYGLVSGFNNVQVSYAQQGNTVTLNANEGWNLLGSSGVDFTISVPDNIDVTIRGGSTDVDMAGINGLVSINVGSGNLHLNTLSGPLSLSSGSGDVTITNEQGSVHAFTASGNIHVKQFSGPLQLTTASGDITLDQAHLSGQDHLQTASGNITFDGSLDPRGSYQLNTSSGDIRLTLPTNTSFHLQTSTSSGDVNNAFGSNTTGSAPYATLILKTASGNITLQK